jgi:hypothetical protein
MEKTNREEFLTTKATKAHKGGMKQRFPPSFVRLGVLEPKVRLWFLSSFVFLGQV